MSNFLVTARKWRPQKFSEVVGQEHITQTLKNALKNDRIAHGYIFAGPRGVGKTTTARILAKAVNCLNLQDGEPCDECEMCKSFLKSQSLDIIEIDGASNRRIEEIRQLRESVKYAPTKGSYKIYIIDEVHMLTTESFNALLKTLEEPPEHTIFIFATTDVHKVPLTIISRCQRFDFRRIEHNTIKNLLTEIAEAEKIKIDDQALTIIAKKADGALRDAESLFDQVISFSGNKVDGKIISQMLNLIDDEIYFNISDAILDKNYAAAFESSKQIYDNGWNFIDFVNGLVEHFRNILSVVIRKQTDLIETAEVFKDRYESYQKLYTESDLLRILAFLTRTQAEMRNAQNQRLKIEVALAQLIGMEKSTSIKDLIEHVQKGKITVETVAKEPVKKNLINTTPQAKTPQNEPKQEETTPLPEPVEEQVYKSNYEPPVGDDEEEEDVPPVPEGVPAPSKHVTPKSLNIDIIQSMWADFVAIVKSDKIYGTHLEGSTPISYKNEKLTVELAHAEDADIIEMNRNHLNDKIKQVFGSGISIAFTGSSDKQVDSEADGSQTSGNSGKEEKSEFIKAVIEELGGKELK